MRWKKYKKMNNTNNVVSLLKVTSVSEVKDSSTKNGQYQTIIVQQNNYITIGTRTLEAPTANIGTRNLFKGRKTLEGKPMKDDALFGQLTTGGHVSGWIKQFNTTPYDIDGKTVTTAKYVIFEGEDAISVANGQLSSKGACVVDENGVPTRDLSKLGVTKVPSAALVGS